MSTAFQIIKPGEVPPPFFVFCHHLKDYRLFYEGKPICRWEAWLMKIPHYRIVLNESPIQAVHVSELEKPLRDESGSGQFQNVG